MPWDRDAAVEYLHLHARSTSQFRCAEYTRAAIEAGGVTLARHPYAKDYGDSLTAVGFRALNFCPATYQAGDIVVIAGVTGHPQGHMAMFDGTNWISDFVQRDFWPGPAYRTAQPTYTVYRYPALPPVGVR